MGEQFKVDTEKIRNKKSDIDKLITACQSIKTKKNENASVGKGPVVDELEEISNSIQQAADSLMALLSNTSNYLGKISGLYDASDENQAKGLAGK